MTAVEVCDFDSELDSEQFGNLHLEGRLVLRDQSGLSDGSIPSPRVVGTTMLLLCQREPVSGFSKSSRY